MDRAKIKTLDDRIICQKLVYFGGLCGVMPAYSYTLYLHGPYSYDLANDLYIISKQFARTEPLAFGSEELEERFKKFAVWSKGLSSDHLEVLATFDWLTRFCGCGLESAKEQILLLKPQKITKEGLPWYEQKLREFSK